MKPVRRLLKSILPARLIERVQRLEAASPALIQRLHSRLPRVARTLGLTAPQPTEARLVLFGRTPLFPGVVGPINPRAKRAREYGKAGVEAVIVTDAETAQVQQAARTCAEDLGVPLLVWGGWTADHTLASTARPDSLCLQGAGTGTPTPQRIFLPPAIVEPVVAALDLVPAPCRTALCLLGPSAIAAALPGLKGQLPPPWTVEAHVLRGNKAKHGWCAQPDRLMRAVAACRGVIYVPAPPTPPNAVLRDVLTLLGAGRWVVVVGQDLPPEIAALPGVRTVKHLHQCVRADDHDLPEPEQRRRLVLRAYGPAAVLERIRRLTGAWPRPAPLISVVALSRHPDRLANLCGQIASQTHPCLDVLLLMGAEAQQSGDWDRLVQPLPCPARVIQVPSNGSVGDGLNEALGQATGDFVAMVGDAQVFPPHHLEDQLAALRLHGATAIVVQEGDDDPAPQGSQGSQGSTLRLHRGNPSGGHQGGHPRLRPEMLLLPRPVARRFGVPRHHEKPEQALASLADRLLAQGGSLLVTERRKAVGPGQEPGAVRPSKWLPPLSLPLTSRLTPPLTIVPRASDSLGRWQPDQRFGHLVIETLGTRMDWAGLCGACRPSSVGQSGGDAPHSDLVLVGPAASASDLERARDARAAGVPVVLEEGAEPGAITPSCRLVGSDPDTLRAGQAGGDTLSWAPSIDPVRINPIGRRWDAGQAPVRLVGSPGAKPSWAPADLLTLKLTLGSCPLRNHGPVVLDPASFGTNWRFQEALVWAAAQGAPVLAPVGRGLPPSLEALVQRFEPTPEGIAASLAPLREPVAFHLASQRTARQAILSHSHRARMLSLLEHLGIAALPPPRISLIASTNRGTFLERLFETFATLSASASEVVLTVHGDAIDPQRVQALADGCSVTVKIVPVPQHWPLGTALNAALEQVTGDYVAKIDDDDFYGQHHLEDLLAAMIYSGADMVGKGANYVFLQSAGETLNWNAQRREVYDVHLPHATTLMSTFLARTLRYGAQRFGEEDSLMTRMRALGGRTYSTTACNFVRFRHGSHAFAQADAGFRALSTGDPMAGLPRALLFG